jgi:hypothetical protein
MGDDPRATLEMKGLMVGEGMEMMTDIGADDLGKIDIGG